MELKEGRCSTKRIRAVIAGTIIILCGLLYYIIFVVPPTGTRTGTEAADERVAKGYNYIVNGQYETAKGYLEPFVKYKTYREFSDATMVSYAVGPYDALYWLAEGMRDYTSPEEKVKWSGFYWEYERLISAGYYFSDNQKNYLRNTVQDILAKRKEREQQADLNQYEDRRPFVGMEAKFIDRTLLGRHDKSRHSDQRRTFDYIWIDHKTNEIKFVARANRSLDDWEDAYDEAYDYWELFH